MSVSSLAQSDSIFRHLRTMKGDIIEFTVDNLDNIYVLNSRNQVKNSMLTEIQWVSIMM